MKFLSLLVALISINAVATSTLIYEAQTKGITLTENDQKVMEVGEISTSRYITGGILGTYPIGFGVGHAVQGRWMQGGWIFTAGELGSLAFVVAGIAGCLDNAFDSDNCSSGESALVATGIIGFLGFRIWEIIDVWAVPPDHNKKYRELKDYIEKAPAKPEAKTSLDLVPLFRPGMGNGLAFRLSF